MRPLRALVLSGLIAAAGCQKVDDLPRLQQDAQVIAKNYQERFEELDRRAQTIARRGSTLPLDTPEGADALRTYRQAQSTLEQGRRNAQQLPQKVQQAAKSGRPGELHVALDAERKRLEEDLVEARTDLAAVESWSASAERRRGAAAAGSAPADRSGAAGEPAGSHAPVQ